MNPVSCGGVYADPPHPESRIALTAMAAIAIPLELITSEGSFPKEAIFCPWFWREAIDFITYQCMKFHAKVR